MTWGAIACVVFKNWGRNATKNTATFGLRSCVTKPWRKILPSGAGSGAVTTPACRHRWMPR